VVQWQAKIKINLVRGLIRYDRSVSEISGGLSVGVVSV
jgi:hypothetical protein